MLPAEQGCHNGPSLRGGAALLGRGTSCTGLLEYHQRKAGQGAPKWRRFRGTATVYLGATRRLTATCAPDEPRVAYPHGIRLCGAVCAGASRGGSGTGRRPESLLSPTCVGRASTLEFGSNCHRLGNRRRSRVPLHHRPRRTEPRGGRNRGITEPAARGRRSWRECRR